MRVVSDEEINATFGKLDKMTHREIAETIQKIFLEEGLKQELKYKLYFG
jgi:hypothetical protein